MIKNIKIYGERCTGTNFLEAIITGKSYFYDNSKASTGGVNFRPEGSPAFKLPIDEDNFGYKHFFGTHDTDIIQKGDETLFIGIVRNPYDWLESLFEKRHHLPYDNWKPNNFLFNEWSYVYDQWSQVDEPGREVRDNNIITGEKYKNVFELRKTKLAYLHNHLPKIAKNYILIRYEDLCNNHSYIIEEISRRFNIEIINHDYVSPIKKIKNKGEFLKEYRSLITENIDWDVERLYNYTQQPVYDSVTAVEDTSKNMREFYELFNVDPHFDYKSYANLYPETEGFWKEYCKQNGIDDLHRLFYHYVKHYGGNYKQDGKTQIKKRIHPKNKEIPAFNVNNAILYSKDIEQILPVDEMFVESYNERTELGKEIAKDSKIAIVALARNCAGQAPFRLQDSINRVKSLCTNQTSFFVYENDSVDETRIVLKNNNIECICEDLNLESLQDRSYTRTERLANYRNVCIEWVKDNHSDADYVIVLDLDADLGFSVDGIYNSIYWLNSIENAGGMGSYSLYLEGDNYVHYDSFAVRMNDWKPSEELDHNHQWVRNWHPLVGSKPVQMYSCFGGLGVYKTDAFLGSKYKGELGSEHVDFHKTMQENGWDMYLNPSSRFFSVFNTTFKRGKVNSRALSKK